YSRGRRIVWPSNTHPPPLGTGLKVVPGELPGVFGFELVAKWFGIVVVHEHEPAPGQKVVVSNKDHIVSLSVGEDANVQLLIPRTLRSARSTSVCAVGRRPSDAYPPHLGSGLDRVPGELPGVFGFELVAKWFGIVVVDEHIASLGGEAVVRGEDRLVALCRG